jgi:hypothetical protein
VSKFSKVCLFSVGGNRLATSLDLDAAQPNYFDSLVKIYPELTATQFGVYG